MSKPFWENLYKGNEDNFKSSEPTIESKNPDSSLPKIQIICARTSKTDLISKLLLNALGLRYHFSPLSIISAEGINKSNIDGLKNSEFIIKTSVEISRISKARNLYYFLSFVRPEIIQFFKFGLVGLTGMAFDLSLVTVFRELFQFDVRTCSLLSFPFAVSSNYFLNSKWTFKSDQGINFKDYFKFFLVNLIGLGTRVWFIHLVILTLPRLGQEFYLLVTFLGILFAFVINFMASKFLVFKT